MTSIGFCWFENELFFRHNLVYNFKKTQKLRLFWCFYIVQPIWFSQKALTKSLQLSRPNRPKSIWVEKSFSGFARVSPISAKRHKLTIETSQLRSWQSDRLHTTVKCSKDQEDTKIDSGSGQFSYISQKWVLYTDQSITIELKQMSSNK